MKTYPVPYNNFKDDSHDISLKVTEYSDMFQWFVLKYRMDATIANGNTGFRWRYEPSSKALMSVLARQVSSIFVITTPSPLFISAAMCRGVTPPSCMDHVQNKFQAWVYYAFITTAILHIAVNNTLRLETINLDHSPLSFSYITKKYQLALSATIALPLSFGWAYRPGGGLCNQPPRLTKPGHPYVGKRNQYWWWFWPLLGKKQPVLRHSRPCYQFCWHSDLVGWRHYSSIAAKWASCPAGRRWSYAGLTWSNNPR